MERKGIDPAVAGVITTPGYQDPPPLSYVAQNSHTVQPPFNSNVHVQAIGNSSLNSSYMTQPPPPLMSVGGSNSTTQVLRCSICSDTHSRHSCPRKLDFCQRCLKRNHTHLNCRSWNELCTLCDEKKRGPSAYGHHK